MRLRNAIIIGVFLIVGLVLIGGSLYLNRIKKQALPVLEGELTLKGLEHPVVVYRDEFGVPTISAELETDLYRAVGYVMASDRLWQMDLLRRVTQGRLSEIFGEDFVDTDLLMRALRMTDKSEKIVSTIKNPEILPALEAFSEGVNQYIAEYKDKLPPEFIILGYKPEDWKPVHSANLIGYMAWDLTMPYSAEIILYKIGRKLGDEYYYSLIPEITGQTSTVHKGKENYSSLEWFDVFFNHADKLESLGLSVFSGSNNWVVNAGRSTTEAPLFANDMHLGLSSPGIWYPMHQHADGGVHVTGVVLPGQPFVVAGHNEKIAWGMTNVMVDDMDFFLEKVSDEKPGFYEFMGEWYSFEEQKEAISIKGGKTVEKTVLFTRHGPVISRFKKTGEDVISMKWLGYEISRELEAVYDLNRAQNWDEFRNAAKGFMAVSQNIAYTDVEGNIGLQTCAGIPVRKKGDGLHIVPGWTDEYEWTGVVPFEELPYSFNPSSGQVSSANNKTAGNDYPYHISYWYALHYRIDRIREMLNSKDRHSPRDFMEMHTDYQSKMVKDILPKLLKVVHDYRAELTSMEADALNLLRTWHGRMEQDHAAPAVFDQFFVSFVENVFLDEMGDSLYNEYTRSSYLARYAVDKLWKSGKSIWIDDIITSDRTETLPDIIWKSFRDAVDVLEVKLGKEPEHWEWGHIHTLTLGHPLGSVSLLDRVFNLNRGPFSVPGSFHTVSPYAYTLAHPYDVNHGASHRHIYNLADWDKSYVILPTGTSGNPASPFYLDQTEMYLNGDYRQDIFTIEKVQEKAKYRIILNSEF
jgi:penicillin G amidase